MYLPTVFALALAAGPVTAQAPSPVQSPSRPATDPHFATWLGCWELDDDRLADRAGVARLCVVPGAGAGVRLLTVVGTRVASDEAITADGVARPITDADCRGTEQAEWATTISGFFRSAEITCGDGKPRRVNSIAFLVRGPSWVDVQAVRTDQEINLRVRRYDRAANQWLPDSAAAEVPGRRAMDVVAEDAVRDWTIESVIEASRVLPAEAVQAAVSELDRGFDLRARQLAALADAGVSEPVIDLMLALTYPERFVVKRMASGGGWSAPSDYGLWMGVCESFDVLLGSPCMASAYYRGMYWRDYGPFWYSGYDWYNGLYGPYYNGGWVEVGSPGGGSPGLPSPGERPYVPGRVVNGMGYTQVSERPPAPVPGFGSRTGSHGGDASSPSSAGVSSQGYSSGGAGSGAERTAQPRPPE